MLAVKHRLVFLVRQLLVSTEEPQQQNLNPEQIRTGSELQKGDPFAVL